MKMKILFIILCLLRSAISFSQNIVYAEYFINTDPGFGNAIALSITPAQDITNISFTADISSLPNGFHHLYIRVKDANGKWSLTNVKTFYKETIYSSLPNIVQAEYFINTDPGIGNATALSVSLAQDLTNLSFTTNISSLVNGFHHLYIRVKDANGKWSQTNVKPFFKETVYPFPQNIVKVEYFFNTDPGFGNGIDVPITPTSDITGLPIAANAIGLPNGTNYFFVRVKDQNGKWTLTNIKSFVFEGEAFNLISPILNQTITTDTVKFLWSPYPNATHYELLVDNNPDFTSPEISKFHIPELNNYNDTTYTICANWLFEGKYYWKVRAVTPFNTIPSNIASFIYNPVKLTQPNWVPLYRAYYPVDADHFYCSSESHLLNAIIGNYQFEGVEGFVSLYPFETSSPDSLKPIYRLYIPDPVNTKGKSHYYTSSNGDKDNRIIQGWKYEGIIGYGLNRSHPSLTKLYHTYLYETNPVVRDNFYTISEIEKNNSIDLFGFSDQGYVCYISATGDNSTITWLPGSIVAGSEINPVNGNFGNSCRGIFSIPEGNISLNYSHFYNSNAVRLLQASEPLGVGWNHNYNVSLKKTEDNIFILWGDEVHVYNSLNLSSETPGVYDILFLVNATTYQVRKKDQTVYNFQKLNISNIFNTYFLTSITDRYGNAITLEYNSNGWLKYVKSPANRYISFTYYPSTDPDKYGLIKYVKDSLALNRQVEYIYDNQRNLIQFKDAEGQSIHFTYDTNSPFDHFLKTITYPDGTIITNTYDHATKRLINQNFISENSNKFTTVSIPTANQVSITDEMNVVTQLKYNNIGCITELTTLSGDAIFEYSDTVNNPTKPTKLTDGLGNITTVSYNNMGDPLQINKPLGINHQYSWNGFNDITSYTNPLGKITNFNYSGGKLTSIQSPFGISSSVTINLTYFANGNIHTIKNPLNQTTTLGYDTYSNLQTISDNIGNTTTYGYDAASRIISVNDANNHITTYAYSPNDFLINTTNPLSNTTSYYYNGSGRLTSVKDAKNNTTSMNYNSNTGLLNFISDQLGNNTSFTYFDNGLLHTKTNRKGQTFTFTYDASNRLQTLTAPSINRTFTYNLNDILTQLSDNNGNLNFTYDQINRLTSHTDYFNNQVQYEYDNANNITNKIYPGNKNVVYTYYDDGSLHTVVDWLNNTTQYLYNNDGSINRVNNPNGTYILYSYDGAGRLIGMQNKKADNSIISAYTYVLDAMGNHLTVNKQEPIQSPQIPYVDISYSYNNANRILNAGTEIFTHDLNGNITNKSIGGINTTFIYNAEDYLTSVSGSFNATYLYDGLGNRRAATRNGNTKRYVLDISGSMEHIIAETNTSDTVEYYYIHGNGLLYRIKAIDNSLQYYHYDYRGSTVAITNAAQTITHQYAYDEFGQLLDVTETDFNPYRFIGKYGVMYENDDIYFMRARYYDPTTGRFLSEDPIWDVNQFIYAHNNPIVFVDKDGYSAINVALSIKNASETGMVVYSYFKNDASYIDVAESTFSLLTGISFYDFKDAYRKNYYYIYGKGTYKDAMKANLNLVKAIPVVGDVYSIGKGTVELFSVGFRDAKILFGKKHKK